MRPGIFRVLMGMMGVFALAVVAFGALAFVWSRPVIVADAAALARVDLPLTKGTIESVKATGPDGRPIPVAVRGGRLWPQVVLTPGEPVSIEVVLRHPGWIAWLAGSRDSERLQLRTPSALLRERYVTLAAGSPLRLAFDEPVRTLAYGQPEHLRRRTLAQPRSQITLARTGEAGSIEVAAAPRSWESLPAPSLVSWFPPGADGERGAQPASGNADLADDADLPDLLPAGLHRARPNTAARRAGRFRELACDRQSHDRLQAARIRLRPGHPCRARAAGHGPAHRRPARRILERGDMDGAGRLEPARRSRSWRSSDTCRCASARPARFRIRPRPRSAPRSIRPRAASPGATATPPPRCATCGSRAPATW